MSEDGFYAQAAFKMDFYTKGGLYSGAEDFSLKTYGI